MIIASIAVVLLLAATRPAQHAPGAPHPLPAFHSGRSAPAVPTAPLAPADSAACLLARFAFGPAPGRIEVVARQGALRWFEAQLEAGDEPASDSLASAFPLLRTSREQLVARFVDARRRDQELRRLAARTGDSTALHAARREARGELPELLRQLPQLTLARAVGADDQVREIMTDFWLNHFNVDARKGPCRVLLPDYVERTIRPRALGRFGDLLAAVAHSPAMLVYLDNAASVAPDAMPPRLERLKIRAAGGDTAARRRYQMVRGRVARGLNENYARELMELHTLGVDGGYNQRDVTEVARVLTGWGVGKPEDGSGFEYHDWAHDRGQKRVLGATFPAGRGQDEGERLLAMLAEHPATARHVCRKLCMRFVADDPPDGAIDAAVEAWRRTGGDIREVLRALVSTPEFWAAARRRDSFKTPFEFTASAMRALGAHLDSTGRAALVVARLGQPLYHCQPPTGYSQAEADWANSGALLQRMNLAVALAAGRVPGLRVDLDALFPATANHEALLDRIDLQLLGGAMGPRTRDVIRREIADLDPARARALAVGLALGGPEFQRQ